MARDKHALLTVRVKLPSGWTILPRGEYSFGRDARCHVVLEGAKVSRRHARIRIDDGGATVADEGSANGVFVNGVRIGRTPQLLSDGDIVVIGDVALEIAFDKHSVRESADTGAHGRATLIDLDRAEPKQPGDPGMTKKSAALELLVSVAERAIATGDAKRAESILQARLNEMLGGMKSGRALEANARALAIGAALKLARALSAPSWIEYVLEVLTGLEALPSDEEWGELDALFRRVGGVDAGKIRTYTRAIEKLPSSIEKVRTLRNLSAWIDSGRARG